MPDWFKKHEIPMVPVKPEFESKGVEYTGPKRRILQSVSQQCSNCKTNVVIALPTNKMRTRGSLFGDDAERKYKGRKVSVYSLVGSDQSLLPEFEREVRILKQRLLPTIPPDIWKINMKDMWAGSSRVEHPVYQVLSLEDVMGFVDRQMTQMSV